MLRLITILILFIILTFLYLFRVSIFTATGEYLYSPTPLKKSDLIVALGGDRWRQREAAGLLKKGMAGHIMLTGADVVEEDYNCLNIPVAQKVLANIPAFTTRDEAAVTLKIMKEGGFKSAIIVTSWYHLRRARLIFEKTFKGEAIELMFYPSSRNPFDTGTWWHSYIGRKLVIIEYIGLVCFWLSSLI